MNWYRFLNLFSIAMLISTFAMGQKLTFSYDASGNQTERKWVCINCPTGTNAEAINDKLLKFNDALLPENEVTERKISVYPNPLTEILNVMWNVPKGIILNRIEVISMNGNKVFTSKHQPDQKETQISFNKMSPGVYILIGYYSDGKKESLKVVKI